MRFKRFRIETYRAISEVSLAVGNNLIPLIGINESGKTSILQAMLAFDKASDYYGRGQHLDYKNKYQLGDQTSFIRAEVVLESEADVTGIIARAQVSVKDGVVKLLREHADPTNPLILERSLVDKKYRWIRDGIEDTMKERLGRAIYSGLPFVLYFDDFTDRVPQKIEFHRDLSKKRGYSLRKSRHPQWQRLIDELISRSTKGKYTVKTFAEIKDRDERDGLLNDVRDVLNKEIIAAWKSLREGSAALGDDSGDLNLKLDYEGDLSKSFTFMFRVEDRASNSSRVFKITDRSKGFQWYFNFLMKLKFNPKYKNKTSGAIYLLDEPGSYLHSSAQEELLRELQRISETNTIVYCTHSQHLLDPTRINVAQVRIVSREDGKVSLLAFGEAGVPNYQGALTPLYDALRLRSGAFNRPVERAVITEGIVDFYVLRMIAKYCCGGRWNTIEFIPGGGASQLRDLISFAIAFCSRYLVLLDSDEEGRKAFDTYTKAFGDDQQRNFWKLAIPGQSQDVRIEALLCDQDQQRVCQLFGSSNCKTALVSLYFAPEESQRAFWENIHGTTQQRIAGVIARIDQIASHGSANAPKHELTV